MVGQILVKPGIRFGAFGRDGKYSGTWICWTNRGTEKRDVFVACRETAGSIKASLHESGNWHVAFDGGKFASMFDAMSAPPSRFLTKLNKPPILVNGLTVACRIFIPWSSVARDAPARPKEVMWLDCPPPGSALEVFVLLSDSLPIPGDWPGRWGGPNVNWIEYDEACVPRLNRPTGWMTQNVGSICPASGGSIQIVFRTIPFTIPPSLQLGSSGLLSGYSEEDLLNPGMRAVLWGVGHDGAIHFFESGVTISRSP